MLTHPDVDFTQAAINQLDVLTTTRNNINNQIEELIARRDQLEQQEAALRQFLFATGALPTEDANPNWTSEPDEEHATSEERGWIRHRLDHELADRIFEVLDKLNGKQMHYKEIVQEIAASGWRWFTDNQNSREAWVNRVLNGDNRFIRPFQRGHYALKKHYPDTLRSVGERRARSRS